MGFVGLFLAVTLANVFTEIIMDDEISTAKFAGIAAAVIAILILVGEVAK